MIVDKSGEAKFRAHFDVSRETIDRLRIYYHLLHKWQNVKNLVSKNTINDAWFRHFADSAQILAHAPGARSWLDIGSGGGFPGMVLAILSLQNDSLARVILVESDSRKCAFLREVARETGANVEVACDRAENVLPDAEGIDVVTARAVAPLSQLVGLTYELLAAGTIGLYMKGQDIGNELPEISKYSMLQAELLQSKTDPNGKIVKVTKRRGD